MSSEIPSASDVEIVVANVETVSASISAPVVGDDVIFYALLVEKFFSPLAMDLEKVGSLINSVISRKFKFKKNCSCNFFGDNTAPSRTPFVVYYVLTVDKGSEFFLVWQIEARQRRVLEKGILKKKKRKYGGSEFSPSKRKFKKSIEEKVTSPSQETTILGIKENNQGAMLRKDTTVEGEAGSSAPILGGAPHLSHSVLQMSFSSLGFVQEIRTPITVESGRGYLCMSESFSHSSDEERLTQQEGEQLWERTTFLEMQNRLLEGQSTVEKKALAEANDILSELYVQFLRQIVELETSIEKVKKLSRGWIKMNRKCLDC
ncbi:hypothetical protein HAX54_032418 [Datura stramonium]|uniref:Uncharacterized protein n=1 Tax=Datura stramonium TaxID=4076 RepID=A0ABS8SCQ3_DATST|nr:hypothetical protein [Datura stramonium]